ncbi:MAG: M20/M25/M40 family metallo-hydrolase [Brevinematia bacterium]
MSLRETIINEFINLVKIDSLSFEEEKVFDYILQRLEGLNLKKVLQSYSVEEIGKKSANLIVKIPANTENATSIFFDAHVDTVEPGREIKPLIDREKGRIESSKDTILAADDKAAVAAMLVAINKILGENFPHGDLYFIFTSAEEIGLVGIQHFDFSVIKPDFGFVLDSHGKVGRIVISAPYHYKYTIRVKGKASHAGIEPEKGINAIKIAARIVAKLPQGRVNRNTVANVGVIEGGKATNIVPDECEITGEFRSINLFDLEKVKSEVVQIVDNFKKYAIGIELELRELYKGFKFERNDDVIKFVRKALKSMGIKPVYEKSCGGSNTNIYNQNGIKCVTISTGMMNVHSTDEYIEVDDLEALVNLILTLCRQTFRN